MATVLDMVKQDAELPQPGLSFARGDIERRLGMPAGRFTSPGVLLPLLSGALLTVGVFAVLWLLPKTTVTDMFTRNMVITPAIVFLTLWSLMMLLVKGRKVALQRRALSLKLITIDEPGRYLTDSSAEEVLNALYTAVDDPQQFFLTRRIHHALVNLRNIGRIGDVDEVLRTQGENDEAQVDSSYTVLRGFIWAIPVLGFIGTVLGLSLAMGSFGQVLAGASEMELLRDALKDVVAGLAVAFETTLQGLVAALCIHLLMVRCRRKEEQFLDDCKEYCQKHIVSRLRLSSAG
ncbi:MAG: MotA/TolQ/ExbB proton channel family protein [Planctomycetota bacterium]|jgi:biopolymer transport protein ExbB/TolQ